jgi:hypothetical protein
MIRNVIFIPCKFLWWTIQFPIVRTMPDSWYAATHKHALLFVKSIVEAQQPFDQPLTDQTKIKLIENFLRLPGNLFTQLTDLQISLLLSKIDKFINDKKTTWPRPWFLIGLKKYHWPRPLFEYMTVEEFAVAEVFYRQVIEGKSSEKALDMLIAYLCRPKGKQISTELAKRTEKNISYADILNGPKYKQQMRMVWHGLTYVEKFAFYWWYYQQRLAIAEKYPNVFKTKNEEKADFTSGYGWHGMIYTVADLGSFGTEPEVKRGDLHDFLNYLNFNIDRVKEERINNRIQNASDTTH